MAHGAGAETARSETVRRGAMVPVAALAAMARVAPVPAVRVATAPVDLAVTARVPVRVAAPAIATIAVMSRAARLQRRCPIST